MNNFIIVQRETVAPDKKLQTVFLKQEALRIAREWWQRGERDYLTRYHNPDWSTCLKRGWSIARKEAEKRRIAEMRKGKEPFELSTEAIKRIEDRMPEWSKREGRSAWS